MSDHASGTRGSVRLATRVALVLGLVGVVAGPLAPLASAAGGLTVTTPFPAVVAEPGSTATFDLAIDVDSARRVNLEIEGLPSGWSSRFRGGGLTIDGAYATPSDAPEVKLDVEIPDDATGSADIRVVATGGGGADTLALSIRVAETAAGDVTLSSDFPELQGKVDTTFTFNVTVANDTPAETQFNMTATGPQGWIVEAKPSGQAQATTLTVDAGGTGTISVTARPAVDAQAGAYPIQVGVSGGGKDATLDLAAIITGTYTLVLSTPDQVLSTTANAGTAKDLALTLTNTGSAPVTGVTLEASAPTNWVVEFEPATIPSVAPGTPVTITATVTPSADAIAGDYELTVSAQGEESTDDVQLRVRVETPQLWWIVGVGLIVAVFAGLYWVFRTYGRR